jgi:hypothetical protein
MVFNTTFNNISVNILAVSFIGGGNQSTQRKLFNFAQWLYRGFHCEKLRTKD